MKLGMPATIGQVIDGAPGFAAVGSTVIAEGRAVRSGAAGWVITDKANTSLMYRCMGSPVSIKDPQQTVKLALTAEQDAAISGFLQGRKNFADVEVWGTVSLGKPAEPATLNVERVYRAGAAAGRAA